MSSPAFAFAEKSPEAFRSISEAAADLDLPQHVLRFWESRFAQLKPVKRAGGRRYYRPEDIDLLRGIRALLYANGLTIKGVQKLLKDRGHRHVAEIGRGARFSLAASTVQAPSRTPQEALRALQPILPLRVVDMFNAEPALLAEQERIKLELLLAELLQFQVRLRRRSSR